MPVRLLARWRSRTNIVRRPPINRSSSDGIRGAVEVIRGVDRAFDLLPGTVEHPPAGVEPDEVLVELVLIVEMLRQTKPVAERAIDDASGPSVGRLQEVTVQIVSRGGHTLRPLESSADRADA